MTCNNLAKVIVCHLKTLIFKLALQKLIGQCTYVSPDQTPHRVLSLEEISTIKKTLQVSIFIHKNGRHWFQVQAFFLPKQSFSLMAYSMWHQPFMPPNVLVCDLTINIPFYPFQLNVFLLMSCKVNILIQIYYLKQISETTGLIPTFDFQILKAHICSYKIFKDTS